MQKMSPMVSLTTLWAASEGWAQWVVVPFSIKVHGRSSVMTRLEVTTDEWSTQSGEYVQGVNPV